MMDKGASRVVVLCCNKAGVFTESRKHFVSGFPRVYRTSIEIATYQNNKVGAVLRYYCPQSIKATHVFSRSVSLSATGM